MTVTSFKRRIISRLKTGSLDEVLAEVRRLPPRQAVSPLIAGLSHAGGNVKWHAVSALGVVMAVLAEEDMEAARNIMRRLMWSLNDESGNIGWGVPEAMAEILANHDGLAEEYAHILVAYMREDGSYLNLTPLQRGLCGASAVLPRQGVISSKNGRLLLTFYPIWIQKTRRCGDSLHAPWVSCKLKGQKGSLQS